MTLNKLWIASGNASKLKELVDFSNIFFSPLSISNREPKSVVEDQASFVGNAQLKARALVEELLQEGHLTFWVLADDSGISVEALGGRPGVHSGRYASAGSNSFAHVEKLLQELKDVEYSKRRASYHSALVLIEVSEGKMAKEHLAAGERQGLVALEPKGTKGYAYDSIFLDIETGLSYGEISYAEKQKDSHRQRAFRMLQTSLSRNQ